MNSQIDLTEFGYAVLEALGHNYGAGRSTYLARNLADQQQVVIKLFRFPKSATEFSGYEKAIAREAQLLSQLNHPAIPRYLNGFEVPEGYCIVQEYKAAPSLSAGRSFEPDQIRQIAIATLEVLVYLQNQTPPIIHRDIKPENLLVDADLNLYLVDFGFARIGKTDVALSSVAAGTFGFMAPEQFRNSELSEATDLYGLGMTLICLLTGIRSTQVDSLIDETNRVKFKHLLPPVDPRFIHWLEKLTASRMKERYRNAAEALAQLQQITDIRATGFTSDWRIPAAIVGAIAVLIGLIFQRSPIQQPAPVALSPVAVPSSPVTTSDPCVLKKQPTPLSEAEQQRLNQLADKLRETRECRGCNLQHVVLVADDLQGVNLQNADLRGADLIQADLSGANLRGANLENAVLTQAKLKNADLRETNLSYGDFGQAELANANLSKSRGVCPNFTQTQMQQAQLQQATLSNANFTQTVMPGANLTAGSFVAANFGQTELDSAKLDQAVFTQAKFSQANLKGASMKGANTANAEFDQTDLP